MNKDDIIRMAREAGLGLFIQYEKGRPLEALERFADLVAAAEREEFAKHAVEIARMAINQEREACAKVCDEYAKNSSNPMNFAENCATAIRARGNK